jgi:hypothetical protein
MSKQKISFSLMLFFISLLIPFSLQAGDVEDRLQAADQSFDKQEFTVSLEAYQGLYEEGFFTERMLYRLAFMNENLKNYPESIYYLKKAAQEFGNEDSESKIKQMMQMNGSTRVFTEDGWNSYFLFYNRYGIYFWIAFAVLAIGLAASLLIKNRKPNSFRSVGLVTGWSLFTVLAVFFIHHIFFSPHRAVLMEKTSFYDFPGYAGHSLPKVFSLGETVAITDEQDIWAKVAAGGREYWVPKSVLRDL